MSTNNNTTSLQTGDRGQDEVKYTSKPSTFYDPETGAYRERSDYITASGDERHHYEKRDAQGVYRQRDADYRADGSQYVHRVYEDPSKGTRLEVEQESSETYE